MRNTLILFVFLLCCLGTCSTQAEIQNASQKNLLQTYSNVNLTFIQNAKIGNLVKSSDKPGYYTLTLIDVNPYTIYFSERPNHFGGLVPTQNFVQAWTVGSNSFEVDNPNGAIVAAKIDGVINKNSSIDIVTLSNPKYNVEKGEMSYLVKPLFPKNFSYNQIQFEYVTLYIDSARI